MKFYLRKIAFYLVAFFFAITINFAIPRMMPGNPVDSLIDRLASKGGSIAPETREAIQSMLGSSDAPLIEQYFEYIKNIFTGNWGVSVTYFPTQVTECIATALPWTVALVGCTTVISFIIQQLLGIAAGWRHGKRFDNIVSPTATVFQSVPYFWLALIFIWLFAKTLGIFPLSGGYNYRQATIGFSWEFISSALYYACLPALAILCSSLGAGVIGMRNMMVSTLGEDYITVAEAKGLSPRRIKYGYAARNAILPSFSGFGTALGHVVGGSLLTEQVFSYPGIGQMMLQAVQGNDYALLQGLFLIITITVLVVNFIVDLLYGIVDPRTRVQD
ncbi:ABC transporter permease [Bifidobacterium oedipodis]|uniref:Peptide ABC transporter permease n=1 Tax=Bifidobacterium oedipodis TaxID=2675322 RepID=A0A7Y0ENX9_9BIFI|nr:ABC transporter permease [Bifidobacterium sp. DSM 109957]NMM93715.1 peptide ABC transporter permease [Bifidobacterium sp. DSM 109957]